MDYEGDAIAYYYSVPRTLQKQEGGSSTGSTLACVAIKSTTNPDIFEPEPLDPKP